MVNLPVEAVVCRAHGEVFRLTWPSGYALFSVKAFELAAGHEELVRATGGDAHRLDAAIAEFGPLCRLMTPDQRREAYLFASKSEGWGERAVCSACHKWKLGARGRFQTPVGLQEHHICIDCVSRVGCQGE